MEYIESMKVTSKFSHAEAVCGRDL